MELSFDNKPCVFDVLDTGGNRAYESLHDKVLFSCVILIRLVDQLGRRVSDRLRYHRRIFIQRDD